MDARKPTDLFEKVTEQQLKIKATQPVFLMLDNALKGKDFPSMATQLMMIAGDVNNKEAKQAAITLTLDRLSSLYQSSPDNKKEEVLAVMQTFATNMMSNDANKEIYYRALLQVNSKNEAVINQIPENDIVMKFVNRENDPILQKIITDTSNQLVGVVNSVPPKKQADMIKNTLVFLHDSRSAEGANENVNAIANQVFLQYFKVAKEMAGKNWDKVNKQAQAAASNIDPVKQKKHQDAIADAFNKSKVPLGNTAAIMAATAKVNENPIEKLAKPGSGEGVKKSDKPHANRHHHKHHHKKVEVTVSPAAKDDGEQLSIKAKH